MGCSVGGGRGFKGGCDVGGSKHPSQPQPQPQPPRHAKVEVHHVFSKADSSLVLYVSPKNDFGGKQRRYPMNIPMA